MKTYIMRINNLEYRSFLKRIKQCKLKNNTKEYFLLLRFYSELNRNVDILKDLEIKNEDNEVMITTDRNVIDI